MTTLEEPPRVRPGATWWERAERLAEAAAVTASAATLDEALQAIAVAAASATGAAVAVVRVAEGSGTLVVRAVAAASRSAAAEAEGSRLSVEEAAGSSPCLDEQAPDEVRRLARRLDAEATLYAPAGLGGTTVGSLELFRAGGPFLEAEVTLAQLASNQVSLAVRVFGRAASGDGRADAAVDALALAGGALAAVVDDDAAEQLVRIVAEASGARAAQLWRTDPEGTLELWACDESGCAAETQAAAEGALVSHDPVCASIGDETCVSVAIGQPAFGVLQLLFAQREAAAAAAVHLGAFAGSAARALRSASRARSTGLELERSRVVLGALEEAIAQLSLAHALTAIVGRVGALFDSEQVAVYLKNGDRLAIAAARGLSGEHEALADRLLELALGPSRRRGLVAVTDATTDERLTGLGEVLSEAAVDAAVAAPLVAGEEVIGLLAVYPEGGRSITEDEEVLLSTLARQLAVAVRNACLHDEAKQMGVELEAALGAERRAARRLGALFEISHSFAESLSLEATLEAVARTAVETLDLDAAVIRVPDARGESLVIQTLHVANPRLEAVLETMLAEPEVLSKHELVRLFRRGRPLVLDPASAGSLGGSFPLLVPFLQKGSTGAVVPLATPTDVLATLTLLSLDPARPIGRETIEAASSIASQAALALENAHLYQQQKQFADTMQRSLLPRQQPRVPGLDLGVVYESSARMALGGDVYDFMALDDGRFAVILGDVTGHGVDAAADMAMAKFVFRSVAREHPEPGEFLAQANEVVAGEIEVGKFITLLYLTIDPRSGALACAGAGHPPPRLLRPDGAVVPIEVSGLALGIEGNQRYVELRELLDPGAAVVLYTDGVVEARAGDELYGVERLDETLARLHGRSAQAIARGLVDDCRRFGGGELVDDCAVVVVGRDGP